MIDTANKYFVASGGQGIRIMNPPRTLTPDDALMLAAWLVALSEHGASFEFADALQAVQNT